jgi:hypothetical protein
MTEMNWVHVEIEKLSQWICDSTFTGPISIEFNCHTGTINDIKYSPVIRIKKPEVENGLQEKRQKEIK